ncbi:proline and serine-rich protein 2 [Pristis pectinata]|uniref:proline and serine-rich protein 2 n=1 Tax=Pristis pectinata TaxID=685728 RepID=UPI00223E21B4|nr:proline and serine-rich protein 2 [Pristis pectinata]
MPVESLYAEMDFDVSPSSKQHSIERMVNGDSGFSSTSRNSDSEDELMNYLSREEQECILFFDNTLDSLKDDFEESSSNSSAQSEDTATPTRSNSENEIIDLVAIQSQPVEFIPKYDNVFPVDEGRGRLRKEEAQVNQEKPTVKEPRSPPPTTYTPQLTKQRSLERTAPEPAIEPGRAYYSQTKPPGSVPTPMVIAQKIAARNVGNGILQPTSPTERKPSTQGKDRSNPTSPTDNRAFLHKNAKIQRFPSNISISMSNKEYNSTISKAAVKVQERKAQVLANLGGASLLAAESDERQLKGLVGSPRQSLSLKQSVPNEPMAEAASKLGSVKESSDETDLGLSNGFRPKVRGSGSSQSVKVHTATNGGHVTSPTSKASTPKPGTTESPPRTESLNTSAVRRTQSFQKPSGFRPQGITVQFSGRGSTDESRKEALRKLGLLKINKDQ